MTPRLEMALIGACIILSLCAFLALMLSFHPFRMDAENWITLLGVCAALFVGLVQVSIYRQQKALQEQANKQSLFEKRYQIFDAVVKYAYMSISGTPNIDTRLDFTQAVRQCPFVLSMDAVSYIRDIKWSGDEIAALNKAIADGSVPFPQRSSTLDQLKAKRADLKELIGMRYVWFKEIFLVPIEGFETSE